MCARLTVSPSLHKKSPSHSVCVTHNNNYYSGGSAIIFSTGANFFSTSKNVLPTCVLLLLTVIQPIGSIYGLLDRNYIYFIHYYRSIHTTENPLHTLRAKPYPTQPAASPFSFYYHRSLLPLTPSFT